MKDSSLLLKYRSGLMFEAFNASNTLKGFVATLLVQFAFAS